MKPDIAYGKFLPLEYNLSYEGYSDRQFWGSNSNNYSFRSSGYTGPKSKQLPLPPNAFSYTKHNSAMTYKQGSEVYDIMLGKISINIQGGALANGEHVHSIQDEGDLLNNTIEKLGEEVRGTIDLSIDIAQAGQTAKMVKATDSIEKLASNLHTWEPTRGPKGSRRNKTRVRFNKKAVLTNPGAVWLEMTYGWKPLVNTVYEAASKQLEPFVNSFQGCKVSRKVEFNNPQVRFFGSSSTAMPYETKVDSKGNHKISYTIRLSFRATGANNPSKWSSLNPASIAWELMPYSFVADWFYDVGSYIRNVETALLYGSDFVGGTVSRVEAYDLGVSESVAQLVGRDGFTVQTYTGETQYLSFNRTILTSYPYPRLPTFKADLGSSRLLSAAALLSTKLK